MVELAPHPGRCFAVGVLAASGQLHGLDERLLDLSEGQPARGQHPFGLLHLAGDPVLFALEQVERDGPLVVGLQEPRALLLEPDEPPLLARGLTGPMSALGLERTMTDAVWLVWKHTPFTEREDSWLRVTLRNVPDQELVLFLEYLEGMEQGRSLIAKWVAWGEACPCGPVEAEPHCEMHTVIRYCHIFQDALDDDWFKLATWYRRLPAREHAATEFLMERLRDLAAEETKDSTN